MARGSARAESSNRGTLVNLLLTTVAMGAMLGVTGQSDASTFAVESNTGSLADLYHFTLVTT